jgi:hypothetical protein
LWLTAWASIESQHRRVVYQTQPDLRIVFYSRRPWKLKVDPTKHRHESSFEPREKVIKPAAWKMAATA